MIAVARAHDMLVMMGCMIETSVGITDGRAPRAAARLRRSRWRGAARGQTRIAARRSTAADQHSRRAGAGRHGGMTAPRVRRASRCRCRFPDIHVLGWRRTASRRAGLARARARAQQARDRHRLGPATGAGDRAPARDHRRAGRGARALGARCSRSAGGSPSTTSCRSASCCGACSRRCSPASARRRRRRRRTASRRSCSELPSLHERDAAVQARAAAARAVRAARAAGRTRRACRISPSSSASARSSCARSRREGSSTIETSVVARDPFQSRERIAADAARAVARRSAHAIDALVDGHRAATCSCCTASPEAGRRSSTSSCCARS